MTKLSLQDALNLLDSEDDPSILMENPDLNEFLKDAEEMGIDILRDKNPEYLEGMISLLQACGIVGLIGGGNSTDMSFVIELMTVHNRSYSKLIASILKFATGLLALEGLR